MEKLVTSEVKLGIIAGGQLGKMLVLAASNWNVNTYVLDKDEHCPASSSCTFFFKGDPLNFDDVYEFGQLVDVLTLELENVNIDALKKLKQEGKRIPCHGQEVPGRINITGVLEWVTTRSATLPNSQR